MTLEQIQYFVTSKETQSFSAAAKRLFVSHTSVSRGVSTLESELDVALFVRNHHSLLCTPAGEVFYQHSKELLRQTVLLRDSVAQYRTHLGLRIASIGAYMPSVYTWIRQFRDQHLEITLVMDQGDPHSVGEKLYRGETDLGILFSYSWPEAPNLDSLVLETGTFCALMSPDHPLANRTYLTQEELAECPDLLGINPFQSEQSPSIVRAQSAILQIQAGGGIMILPEHAAAEFGKGCIQVPILGADSTYQVLMGWRTGNKNPAVQVAIDFFGNSQGKPNSSIK